MCFVSSVQYVSIVSYNGLALFRWQAIIWTNVDPVHRRIYAALQGDELLPGNIFVMSRNNMHSHAAPIKNLYRNTIPTPCVHYNICATE